MVKCFLCDDKKITSNDVTQPFQPLKMAILFSGRIHGFNETFEHNNQYIIKDNAVDYYLSHSINDKDSEEDLLKFQHLYNPVVLLNTKITYVNVSKYVKRPETNAHSVMCMFSHRKNVWDEMEKKGNTYGIYISNRVDNLVEGELDLKYFTNMKDNEIYVPEGNDWRMGINDQFAVGNFKSMKIYMSLINELYNMLNDGVVLHPETLLKNYLQRKNINIVRFPLQYKIIK
jgi:hypothetical protein